MIEFTKMQALGNDFIVIEEAQGKGLDLGRLTRSLCHRHAGIGADGMLLVCPSATADVRMRIFNSDGSEASMCGNGIRCFARYVFEKGITRKELFRIETPSGEKTVRLNPQPGPAFRVAVGMGKPELERECIPMLGGASEAGVETFTIDGQGMAVRALRVGVPHAVLFVDDLESVDLARIGPAIERAPVFPEGTNVNAVQVLDREHLIMRTWERGGGLTLACGTGACAAVVASFGHGLTGRTVTVDFPLGCLVIDYQEDGQILMDGPADFVFSGMVEWPGPYFPG